MAKYLCDIKVNIVETFDGILGNVLIVAVTQFKGECLDEMFKFMRGERIDKELSLIKVFLEFRSIQFLLDTGDLLLVNDVGTSQVAFFFCGWNVIETIGPVIDYRFVDRVSHESVSLIVHHRAERSVDGKIVKIE